MIETEKLIGVIFINDPKHPENYNHPETGRQNYIHAIAYETDMYSKSVAELLKELINQFKNQYEIEDDVEDDGDYPVDFVIDVRDIRELILELEK